jgi:hypothetical protein
MARLMPAKYVRPYSKGPKGQKNDYVGNLKGVGRVYQQTFIDTYAKVACAKLYDRKTPITELSAEVGDGLKG